MISTLPPRACGIAAYAGQHMEWERRQGREFNTISLGVDFDRGADLSLNPASKPDWSAIFRFLLVRRWNRVTLNFTSDFFPVTSGNPGARFKTVMLLLMFRICRWNAREFEIIVHECKRPEDRSPPERVFDRRLFALADRIVFHTDRDRDVFQEQHSPGSRTEIVVREHGRHFRKHYASDPATARSELGIPSGTMLFLCIGFIQASKGFDSAIRAFITADRAGGTAGHAALRIVGECRSASIENVSCKRELSALARNTDADVEVIADFVSDREFDRWICASDYVVLPYREIWSSSVAARAKLYEKPIMARRLPGLRAQLGEGGADWFATDEELARLMGETFQHATGE